MDAIKRPKLVSKTFIFRATYVIWLSSLLIVTSVSADYQCVCSQHVQLNVYRNPDVSSEILGYIYQDECKAKAMLVTSISKWDSVIFEHEIGYIIPDFQIKTRICGGSSPLIYSTHAAPTVPKTTPPSSHNPQTTTSSQQSHHPPTTRHQSHHPPTTRHQSHHPPTTRHQSHHPPTSPTSTHRPRTTGPSTAMPSGHSDVHRCQYGGYTNTSLKQLGFLNGECFKLSYKKSPWNHAEKYCHQHNNGHLLRIPSNTRQNYIVKFLLGRHTAPNVWIGLNDIKQDGHFTWGWGQQHVTYTNWAQDGNQGVQGSHDCALLKPQGGKWGITPCSEHHSWICQYPPAVPVFVG